MNARSSQSRLRSVASTLAVALTLALAAAAGCDSRQEPELPSVQEKMRETHIYGQSKLRIGVATNEPLMGELRNGQHVGFDVEIARYIAASLGYEGDQRLEFVLGGHRGPHPRAAGRHRRPRGVQLLHDRGA